MVERKNAVAVVLENAFLRIMLDYSKASLLGEGAHRLVFYDGFSLFVRMLNAAFPGSRATVRGTDRGCVWPGPKWTALVPEEFALDVGTDELLALGQRLYDSDNFAFRIILDDAAQMNVTLCADPISFMAISRAWKSSDWSSAEGRLVAWQKPVLFILLAGLLFGAVFLYFR